MSNNIAISLNRNENINFAKEITLFSISYPHFGKIERYLWFFRKILQRENSSSDGSHFILQVKTASREFFEKEEIIKRYTKELGVELSLLENKNQSYSHEISNTIFPFTVTSLTKVSTIYCKYRFVLCLDLSPSVATIDTISGVVIIDHIFTALEKCLRGLILPIQVPSLPYLILPEIYLTIIAHGSVLETIRVLIQGILLSSSNIESVLSTLKTQIQELENEIKNIYSSRTNFSSSLQTLIQNSAFALKLLPSDACPALILITDGVVYLPSECSNYDSLIMLLNRDDIPCSIFHIGNGNESPVSFGYVADTETMLYLTESTGGKFFNHSWLFDKDLYSVQELFMKQSSPFKIYLPSNELPNEILLDNVIITDTSNLKSLMSGNSFIALNYGHITPPTPLVKTIIREGTVNSPFLSLLDYRLSEGFKIDSISTDENRNLLAKLIFFWQSNVYISYTLINSEENACKIILEVFGYYEFMQHLTSSTGNKKHLSPYRLQHFLSTLINTDTILGNIISHTKNLNIPFQHDLQSKFLNILKYLDGNWYKYLKIEKLELLISPSGHIAVPPSFEFNFSGAAQAVDNICSQWFDFNYEKKIFVKFLASKSPFSPVTSPSLPPYSSSTNKSATNSSLGIPSLPLSSSMADEKSFCLLQVSWETKSLAVLQLAFFGTTSRGRIEAVSQLREALSYTKKETLLYSSPMVLSKSLRSLLVRYEPHTKNGQFTSIPSSPTFQLLKSYLHNRRWIWVLNESQSRQLAMRILMNARLKEGFFIANNTGMYTFIKELPSEHLKKLSCLIQYTIFEVLNQFLVTEIWMEPQSNISHGILESFQEISKPICNFDLQVISSISSFDILLNKLKGHAPTTRRNESIDNDKLEKIPFDLADVLFCCPEQSKFQAEYRIFLPTSEKTNPSENDISSSSSTELESNNNSLLFKLLIQTLSELFKEIETPPNEKLKKFGLLDCRNFARMISINQVILVFLRKMTPFVPFQVSFFECYKEYLYEKSTIGEALLSKIYRDSIVEHHRNFVKVMYTNLRDKQPIHLSDFQTSISFCQTYTSEIDISEYIQLVSKLNNSCMEYFSSMSNYFNKVLEHNFRKIEGTEYYYYVKEKDSENKQKEQEEEEDEIELDEDFSSDEEEDEENSKENKESLDEKNSLGIFPIPFFLRIESVVSSSQTISLKGFPTLLTHPELFSNPNEVSIKFVCQTLGPTLDSFEQGNVNPSDDLPVPLNNVIRQKRRILKILISKTILELLRNLPLDKSTLDQAMHHIKKLASKSLSKTLSIPLLFLDIREGRKRLPIELEKNFELNLKRIEEMYVVMDSTTLGEQNLSKTPYWLVIRYQQEGLGDSVNVHFYSDSLSKVERSELFFKLRSGMKRLCIRINQLILLEKLHENKICNPLLEIPSNEDENSPSSENIESSDSTVLNRLRNMFSPGQFACPVVHTMILPLHQRVPSSQAMVRCSTVLHPFYVLNRKNLFEYREESGKVFYLKLSEKIDPENTLLPPSTTINPDAKSLIISVHGVDRPGTEITEHLFHILESKLALFTLTIISTLLDRNPSMKLTFEDIQYIRGSSLSPVKTTSFKIPVLFPSFYFLLYFKQILEKQFLVVMQPPDEPESLNFLKGEPLEDLSHFTMVYNFIRHPKVASPPIHGAIGQGIAIIRVSIHEGKDEFEYASKKTLTPEEISSTSKHQIEPQEDEDKNINEQSQVVYPTKKASIRKSGENASDLTSSSLSTETEFVDSTLIEKVLSSSSSHTLVIDIWARESILNLKAFVNQLRISVNQTFCDCILEKYLHHLSIGNLHYDLLDPCSKLLKRSIELSHLLVHEIQLQITLPSWTFDNFVTEMKEMLLELSPSFVPKLFISTQKEAHNFVPYSVSNLPPDLLLLHKNKFVLAILGGKFKLKEELEFTQVDPLPSSSASTISLPSYDFGETSQTFEKKDSKEEESISLKQEIYRPEDSALFPAIKLNESETLSRSCFVLIIVDSQALSIFTYNWNNNLFENFNATLTGMKNWILLRKKLLSNMLHQKMGLFHHVPFLAPSSVSPTPSLPSSSSKEQYTKFTIDNIDPLLTYSSNRHNKGESTGLTASSRPSHRKKIRPNFNIVLMNKFPFEPYHQVGLGATICPVRRHGKEVKQVFFSHQGLYLNWERLNHPLEIGNPDELEFQQQLQSLINSSQLIFSKRMPFLCHYNPKHAYFPEPLYSYSNLSSSNLQEIEKQRTWYHALLKTFFKACKEYADFLGFQLIYPLNSITPSKDTNNSANQPPAQTKPNVMVSLSSQGMVYFFQKLIRSGVLILRFSSYEEDTLVGCDLFALHRFPLRSNYGSQKFDRGLLKPFVEECNRIQQQVDLSALIYDFHVNQLIQFFNQKKEDKITYPSLQFVTLLRDILKAFPSPPHLSFNTMLSSTLTIDLEPHYPAYDLFLYMASNAQVYGYTSMEKFGIIPAFFKVSQLRDDLPSTPNNNNGISNSPNFHLISGGVSRSSSSSIGVPLPSSPSLFSISNTSSEVEIVFILSSGDISQVKNRLMLNFVVLEVQSSFPYTFILTSSSSSQTGTLKRAQERIQALEKELPILITKVLSDHKRDMLWNKLASSPSRQSPLTEEEFSTLKKLTYCQLLQEIDPSLNPLLSTNVVWSAFLAQVVPLYPKHVKVFSKQSIKETNMILFSPYTNNCFIHISLTESQNQITFSYCCKESLTPDYKLISDVINHILYFLWKRLVR